MIKNPHEIEELSLKTIMEEAAAFPGFSAFTPEEQKVVQRMIHATTCFEQIINNIVFTDNAINKIKSLIQSGAVIITDTNMIKAGLSKLYTNKYENQVICYVSNPDIAEEAKQKGVTRTEIAVKKALKDSKDRPVILACGNAPTFLYSALAENINVENMALFAMPVGFINVVESKEYALKFMQDYGLEGIVLKGRYGGSPLVVSALHAIYKMI